MLLLSIGIPAYNEEANIKFLIESLLRQKLEGFDLLEIIVISDGSSDKTCEMVESIKNDKIKLIKKTERLGQQARQNELLKLFKGDCLALIEADTLPGDENSLRIAMKSFMKGGLDIGLVVGASISGMPNTLMEKIFHCGQELKNSFFMKWNNGENVYSSGGHSVRILSKTLTAKLMWPNNITEDSYLYLRNRELGLKFIKENSSIFLMKNVSTLSDSIKQSRKYVSGHKSLPEYFGRDLIKKEYRIPRILLAREILIWFMKYPICISLYCAIVVINRLASVGRTKFNPLYVPYLSSKRLISTNEE